MYRVEFPVYARLNDWQHSNVVLQDGQVATLTPKDANPNWVVNDRGPCGIAGNGVPAGGRYRSSNGCYEGCMLVAHRDKMYPWMPGMNALRLVGAGEIAFVCNDEQNPHGGRGYGDNDGYISMIIDVEP